MNKIFLWMVATGLLVAAIYYTNWFTFKKDGIPFRLVDQAYEAEMDLLNTIIRVYDKKQMDFPNDYELNYKKEVVKESENVNTFRITILVGDEEETGLIDWYNNEDKIVVTYDGYEEVFEKLP